MDEVACIPADCGNDAMRTDRAARRLVASGLCHAEDLIQRIWLGVEKHNLPSPALCVRFHGEGVEIDVRFAAEDHADLIPDELEWSDGTPSAGAKPRDRA